MDFTGYLYILILIGRFSVEYERWNIKLNTIYHKCNFNKNRVFNIQNKQMDRQNI
jgi:hypothetical protein